MHVAPVAHREHQDEQLPAARTIDDGRQLLPRLRDAESVVCQVPNVQLQQVMYK
jgi:hypothetical protein